MWRRQQLWVLLASLALLSRESPCSPIQELSREDLLSFFSSELKREISEEFRYGRPLRCLDMLSVEGRFSFLAERPQLSCAVFIMLENHEVAGLAVDGEIDCGGGDAITVFDGWVMKGETFPSSQDHPLSLRQRYRDYCAATASEATPTLSVGSSQNVAMVFFRIHRAGGRFTLTVRRLRNPSPCNVLSQAAEGSFTLVTQQRKNCSFSIIYPVDVHLSHISLGSGSSCSSSGDVVELLGGNGLDTSQLRTLTELCSTTTPTTVTVGCDSVAVRMVSSGRFLNRVSFSYRRLDQDQIQDQIHNRPDHLDFCYTT